MACFSQSTVRSKSPIPGTTGELSAGIERAAMMRLLRGMTRPRISLPSSLRTEDVGWLGKHRTHWGRDLLRWQVTEAGEGHQGKRRAVPGSWSLSRKTLEISQLGPFPRRLLVDRLDSCQRTNPTDFVICMRRAEIQNWVSNISLPCL